MASVANIDLFVEDEAHEAFIGALVRRLRREAQVQAEVHVRWATGGHGHVLSQLGLFQKAIEKFPGMFSLPHILVVATDANCQRYAKRKREIMAILTPSFAPRTVIACPDPHVERWYIADPPSFKEVVGVAPRSHRRTCQRDLYKHILVEAIRKAGHVPTLGGIEFAQDLVEHMDLARAGRAEQSLDKFVSDLRQRVRSL